MTGFNPYQPPAMPSEGQWAQSQGQVSPAIIDSLRKTRPWVMLIAILGSIWTGLMGLGAVGMLAGGGEAAKLPTAMGFGYLVATGIALLPLVAMFRFSGAINRLMHGGGQQELERAIDAQRSYWQIVGIMTLIGIVFMVLAIVLAVGFAASFAKF